MIMSFRAQTGPVLATRTVSAINLAVARDRGNLFRRYQRETIPLAEDAYREDSDPFRTHLGASLIGRDCLRELWYAFRWTTHPDTVPQNHDGTCSGANCELCAQARGRMQRLYNRGHLEEARFIAMLKMIGCQVWQHDQNQKQFRVSYHSGHFGGSVDSVVLGCPDDLERPLLGEFKTHNDKSFSKLVKEGVRSSKLTHFVQMQIYMGGLNLTRALYLAVNKDTDDLYGELIWFEEDQYLRYLDRAKNVIQLVEPPKKVNESPGWFTCRFCDQRLHCHQGTPAHVNCRTCRSCRPNEEGQWFCDRYCLVRNKHEQLAACSSYEARPN